MQCSRCKAPAKEGAVVCRRCGTALGEDVWQPGWKWSAKVLGITYASLTAGYLILRIFL